MSVRRGIRPGSLLHQGFPSHLHSIAERFFEGACGYYDSGGMHRTFVLEVAARVEISLPSKRLETNQLMRFVFEAARRDEDLMLDLLDATLHARYGGPAGLRRGLEAGRSVWTVSDDGRRLVERVTSPEQQSFDLATGPADQAAQEIAEAWENVFGLHPDPSDAWDHSIRAVECLLIPLVVPKQAKANLGHVLGSLRAAPQRVSVALGGPAGVDALVAMLGLLWPNPDRHPTPGNVRVPTEAEARSVVLLATTIVGWARNGFIELS